MPVQDPARSLGEQIRAARERLTLSQKELAAMLGCSERSIQDYEAGKDVMPRPALRRRIYAWLAENAEQAA